MWQPIETAPRDGTLLLLLVDADEDREDSNNPTEDAMAFRTIGHNNFAHDEEDAWRFAGWCWQHDHFVEGHGKPTHWQALPPLPEPLCKCDHPHCEHQHV